MLIYMKFRFFGTFNELIPFVLFYSISIIYIFYKIYCKIRIFVKFFY